MVSSYNMHIFLVSRCYQFNMDLGTLQQKQRINSLLQKDVHLLGNIKNSCRCNRFPLLVMSSVLLEDLFSTVSLSNDTTRGK